MTWIAVAWGLPHVGGYLRMPAEDLNACWVRGDWQCVRTGCALLEKTMKTTFDYHEELLMSHPPLNGRITHPKAAHSVPISHVDILDDPPSWWPPEAARLRDSKSLTTLCLLRGERSGCSCSAIGCSAASLLAPCQ